MGGGMGRGGSVAATAASDRPDIGRLRHLEGLELAVAAMLWASAVHALPLSTPARDAYFRLVILKAPKETPRSQPVPVPDMARDTFPLVKA